MRQMICEGVNCEFKCAFSKPHDESSGCLLGCPGNNYRGCIEYKPKADVVITVDSSSIDAALETVKELQTLTEIPVIKKLLNMHINDVDQLKAKNKKADKLIAELKDDIIFLEDELKVVQKQLGDAQKELRKHQPSYYDCSCGRTGDRF